MSEKVLLPRGIAKCERCGVEWLIKGPWGQGFATGLSDKYLGPSGGKNGGAYWCSEACYARPASPLPPGGKP